MTLRQTIRTTIFSVAFSSLFVLAQAGPSEAVTIDFDHDGHADILWHHGPSGDTQVWFMNNTAFNGSVGFATNLEVPDSTDWRLVGVSDFNRDGNVDLLWHEGVTGDSQLWHMNGLSLVGQVMFTPDLKRADGTGWRVVGTNDFNGDGWPDILWHNGATGDNEIWHMNDGARVGTSTFDASLKTPDATGWRVVGTNDFNGDGRPDILWHNGLNGQSLIWYMNDAARTGTAPLTPNNLILDSSGWRVVGTDDFNLDGHPDILWHNGKTGETQIWYMNNATFLSSATVAPGINVLDSSGWRVSDGTLVGSYQGTWSTIATPFGPGSPSHIQLLMDGSILAVSLGNKNSWYRYFPDSVLGYAGGVWTTGPAKSRWSRTFFTTGLMADGRYFVGGGEYLDEGICTTDAYCTSTFGAGNICNTVADQNGARHCQRPDGRESGHDKCEIYNPMTNFGAGKWSDLPDFPADPYLADAVTAPLPNGRLLVGAPSGISLEFDPTKCPQDGSGCQANAWTNQHSTNASPPFGEGSFAALQDGNVFFSRSYFDAMSNPAVGATHYVWGGVAGTSQWSSFPHGPGQGPLFDPFSRVGTEEGASVLTLYDGRVFITSASGHNAMFDPSVAAASNPINNVATTPNLPVPPNDLTQIITLAENNQSVMPTGNALCAATPDYTSFTFYEYDPSFDYFTNVSTGGPAFVSNGVLFQTPLPDGSTLVANASTSTMYIYKPVADQLVDYGQPTITSISGPVQGVYTLTGTTLNGLTNGANRDDEGQNYTSFPVVWVTYDGLKRYCNVKSTSTTSIAPGATSTIQFVIPPDVPHVQLTVALSASGLASSNSVSIVHVEQPSYQLPSTAKDIGVGGDGSIWSIGTTAVTGGFKIYKWNGNNWVVDSNGTSGATRISVGPDGRPWVVTSSGGIARKTTSDTSTGFWETLPSTASDIGVGADGSAWITGTTAVTGGFKIYKWNGTSWDVDSNGASSASRIAVGPTGVPWVVKSTGGIFRKTTNSPTSGTWETLATSGARDVAVGLGNYAWSVKTSGSAMILQTWTEGQWMPILSNLGSDGANDSVAAGLNGRPFVVDNNGIISTTSF